ncbi:MAG: HlyD family efflux transporter periplasmic adaptor subunit [Candidatus Omnitrophota bacterium]|jgi:macrolide-specific efflux system membrane fusion protein|nr:efflux RND transporter periplasmic adaptor subunit [Candidatus Omnitrophota bacterium]MDD5518330.1 efflux RND transporter periplasmic adaptor subunit [Candidatus Omnitrophota bacterium]
MRKIKSKIIVVILVLLAVSVFIAIKIKSKEQSSEIIREVKPVLGIIQTYISTTGTVYPKNRLEVKPPVNGRIESIAVKEGEKVKDGQVLAWMSSTERAALLDAAQGQGEAVLKYWEQVYKPISLLSPIDGEVIVATTQPGQTVTTSDAVVVLSDHLIVRAQVDETDIGKIKLGQGALVTLDAYLDTKIKATVEHIYYESETVNNVTIYKVDLIPEKTPEFFRSGMNATIDFKAEGREDVLLLPVEAVRKEKSEDYVLLKNNGSDNPVKRVVKTGITDDKNYEILSGVTSSDTVLVTTKKYVFPSADSSGSNPFLPNMKRRGSNKK